MSDNLIYRTESAYTYPLLIKNLLQAPAVDDPQQEIVYRDLARFTYAEFRQRVCKLANALTKLGVKAGDTVAMMDCLGRFSILSMFASLPNRFSIRSIMLKMTIFWSTKNFYHCWTRSRGVLIRFKTIFCFRMDNSSRKQL